MSQLQCRSYFLQRYRTHLAACLTFRLLISICLALLAGVSSHAQKTLPAQQTPAAHAQDSDSQQNERKTSKPYTGDLSIFEYEGRDKKLQINRVMDLLGIKPGKIVADIGAGSGWFTVRAARRVTPTGVVYAV